MLPLQNPIVSIEYQTGELVPELTDILRNTIVDIRCTDTEGRQFLVEMQLFWNESFKSRVLFNASKAYAIQLNKNEDFKLLKPVYALNFINQIFEKSPEMKDEYYHYYKIVNIKDTEKQIEGLEFLFVELPKFKPQNRSEKKLHELWLRFLTEINETTEEAPADLLENEYIREAVSYVERAAYTKAQLYAYDQCKLNTITQTSMLSASRAEGEAIGLEKGKAEGKAEEQEQFVIKGYKKGHSIELISSFTDLTPEQIILILKRHELINR